MNLKLHIGSQALMLVRSEEFQSKWKSLYDGCPWVTAFQHPDFVTPWYELYYEKFLPVIVLGEAEDKSLVGLFTLALHENGKKLVGAGERQAEYQGWLEKPEAGNAFIQDAVKKIFDFFPGVDLCLKYLSPGIPLNWISLDRDYEKIFCLRSHARPIMKIDAVEMERQRRKKNHRQNFNRLNKLGEVRFEKVSEHDHFIRIFDEMCIQYDFRQGALHHNMPFSNDPVKKLFCLELHKRGLLHTTILTVGGEIVASHFGLMSQGSAVHLGINTHAPAFAAHSPGNLFLAMLGVYLAEEKIPVLDLTPGGDGYKENFATEHDVVFDLIAYGNVMVRWRTEALLSAKRIVKNKMQKAGMSTADVWRALGRLTRFKEIGLLGVLEHLRDKAITQERVYRYCQETPSPVKNPLLISKDCLNDILLYDSRSASVTRWEFLKMAMERMERSSHLYSFVRNEKLLISCWVSECYPGQNQKLPEQLAALPDAVIVLSDLYVHRQFDVSEIVQHFIAQILCELKSNHDTQFIYFSGALSNELQTVIQRCGFIDESQWEDNRSRDLAPLDNETQNFSTGDRNGLSNHNEKQRK